MPCPFQQEHAYTRKVSFTSVKNPQAVNRVEGGRAVGSALICLWNQKHVDCHQAKMRLR